MKISRFFNPDNMFFRELSHLVDVVGLSLLWLLLCFPVVTIGPSTAALYHTAVKGLRHGDTATFTRFLRSFRENFKQGVIVSLIMLPIALLMKLGLDVMYTNSKSSQGLIMLSIYVAVLLIPLGILSWIFPLMGRFTFSTKQLFSTAFKLSIAHLPVSMLAAVITVAAICAMGFFVWPVLFVPMLTALILSFLFEKVFKRYMTEEENTYPEE